MTLISAFSSKVQMSIYRWNTKDVLNSYLLSKEVTDRDISPKAWTVTYFSYSTLFHSPLVGQAPHVFLVFFKSGSGQSLSQGVRNILSTCTFDKFHMVVSNQVTEKVYLDIDMS